MFANKKAISEIVSYVLLVVLAVVLASAVYVFLKPYAEKPLSEDECPDGISIVVERYNCYNDTINLTLKNRGIFAVNAVRLKIINYSDDYEYDFWSFIPFCAQDTKCTSCRASNCFALSGEQTEKISYAAFNKIEKLAVYPIKEVNNKSVVCKEAVNTVQISGCNESDAGDGDGGGGGGGNPNIP